METGQKNRNRDIYKLKGCQGMLDEIRMLREKDSSERRALIGSPRFDGMPHGGGGSGLEDVLARACGGAHSMSQRGVYGKERDNAG